MAEATEEQSIVATYIGPKGYSIYKTCIDEKEQKQLREELNVGAYIPKAPIQPPTFPIFRESKTKLYIPRHFGLNTYGEPDEIRIPKGDDIALTFNGEMRDYQINIVDIFMKTATKVSKE